MRIAHIESSMNWGGQELRIIEQTEWLNRNAHRAWVIAHPEAAIMHEARERGLPVFALKIRNAFDPVIIYRLKTFLDANHIDILDAHSSKDSVQAFFVRRLHDVAVIRSRHTTDPLKHDIFHKLIWIYGNDRVITTAQKTKDHIVEVGLRQASMIDVAVAGVCEKRFRPQLRTQNADLRRSLDIPPDHFVVTNIGMIREDKGQLFFVRACAEVGSAAGNVTFLQVGEATATSRAYKERVLAEAKRLPPQVSIRFLGYKADIENYLSMSDILVVSSIRTEAQTRLVSQAFLTKTAVLATAVGGLPEMIENGRTGLLCAPQSAEALADGMFKLLRDAPLRADLCGNALRHALDNMTFDKMMEKMLVSYQKALASRRHTDA